MRSERALILDFDGTCTHLFPAYDFKRKKREMHEAMMRFGVDHPADGGIFGVFSSISDFLPEGEERNMAYLLADDILTSAETEALELSVPIEGAAESMRELSSRGWRIGFSTNNAPSVVRKWLGRNRLDTEAPVFGRDALKPELMKPSPHTVLGALSALGCTGKDSFMIGDHPRDREAAMRAGTGFIGLGSTERKYMRLMEDAPGCTVVRTWKSLLDALLSVEHM